METFPPSHRVTKLLAIAAVALLVSPAWAEAAPNSRAKMSEREIASQSGQRTLGYRACSLCYTCGGPWSFKNSLYRGLSGKWRPSQGWQVA